MNRNILIFILLVAVVVIGYVMYNREEVIEPNEEDPQTQMINLYYYDAERDTDSDGNIICSRDGLVAVEREIELEDSVEDAIDLLLEGNLASAERARGITTEYPLAGFELASSTLENGVLTLHFNDPQNKTVGGSCRAGILWFQIEETAMQFDNVNSVRFTPEDIFQP